MATFLSGMITAGFLVAAAVGWSRVRLGRHTVVEVVGGATVGAAVCAVVLPLLT